jgi:hypothetical protein
MSNQIADELTTAAVRAVPMDDVISVTGWGSQYDNHVDISCGTCSWYSDHVAPPVGRFDTKPVTGRVTRRVGTTPVADLNQAAGAHSCPPEVAAAAQAARAARGAAAATVAPASN